MMKDYEILNLIPLLRKIEREYKRKRLYQEGLLLNAFRSIVLADITQQMNEGTRFKDVIIDREMQIEDKKSVSLLPPLISDEEKEELRKIETGEVKVI